MPNEVLGGFEHQVLLAVLRLGSGAYSVPIVLELEERTGRSVASSKVYVTLRRLENRSLVRSRFEPPPTDEGGRERRVFTLEPPGLDMLKKSKQVFSSLWEDLPILDET